MFPRRPDYSSKQEMAMSLEKKLDRTLHFKLIDAQTRYDFPEEDFCLYKYFPSRKAIHTRILRKQDDLYYKIGDQSGKCTIDFLVQNSPITMKYHVDSAYPEQSADKFDLESFEKCDFPSRLEICYERVIF